MIDLISDTVTRPSKGMLDAMMTAPLGDDVFGEDPTTNRLQSMAAQMFGKEAALFCPSGTMTNQIAIGVHVRPGDEVICSELAHIYLYEGGGIARNSGAQVHLLKGDFGRINANEVADAIRPGDSYYARTSLVSVEDTVNKGGGACYDFDEILGIKKVCTENNLKLHLDGARVFNSLVVSGMEKHLYAAPFDSISICLSKGLGAPVGSLLLGTKAFIAEAHRSRKVMGGGMRQAGILAAAGIYALENNINRLSEDHYRASILARALSESSFVKSVLPCPTNIVIFELKDGLHSDKVSSELRAAGLRGSTFGPKQMRLVTHLDFDENDLDEAINIIKSYNG